MLIDGLEWCGLLMDYCDVFIRCLDSHSDGTYSLQSEWDHHNNLHFSKSDEKTKLIHILYGLRMSKFWVNFHFWMNYTLNAPFTPRTITILAFKPTGDNILFIINTCCHFKCSLIKIGWILISCQCFYHSSDGKKKIWNLIPMISFL